METMETPGAGTYAWDNSWADARRRLELLEQCWDPRSQEALSRAGVQPGWRCLEVGGGAGSIASWLCDAVGPDGTVVAVDLDTRFLGLIAAVLRDHPADRRDAPVLGPRHARPAVGAGADRRAVLVDGDDLPRRIARSRAVPYELAPGVGHPPRQRRRQGARRRVPGAV